jgi:hypothetical protein
MTKARTFAQLVRRAGALPVTGMASAESPPASAAAKRAAETLVGGLPGAARRVSRVAKKLDRLAALESSAGQSRKRAQHG